MPECPCCSSILLHPIRRHQVYWFCRHCWQAMLDLEPRNPIPGSPNPIPKSHPSHDRSHSIDP